MTTNINQEPSPNTDRNLNNLLSAFGSILGYLGAEAASYASFEELLWPQRFFCSFNSWEIPQLALLHPMGGPLHKVALETLDIIFKNGLLRGHEQGHMLGTPFFPETGWTYVMHDGQASSSKVNPLRNCFWTVVFSRLNVLALINTHDSKNVERGDAARQVRSQVIVGHLLLSRASVSEKSSRLPFVEENAEGISCRIILAIIVAELAGILIFIILLAVLQTWWSVLWLVPLLLRLTSAYFSLQREPLISLASDTVDNRECDFEIQCPQSNGNFLVLTGTPAVVLQFARHYGHPVRNRTREMIQLGIIAGFLLNFPFGLLFSALWMPLPVQYTWIGYQIYTVLAMITARYLSSFGATTTESYIAKILEQETDEKERALLFGQKRDSNSTIKASLFVTYHRSYGDGKRHAAKLLRHSWSRKLPIVKAHSNPPSPGSAGSTE